MSKRRGFLQLVQLPLRMHAPTSFYGLPYQLSSDRRTVIYRSRQGYDFEPEIAIIEGAIYADQPKIENENKATFNHVKQ